MALGKKFLNYHLKLKKGNYVKEIDEKIRNLVNLHNKKGNLLKIIGIKNKNSLSVYEDYFKTFDIYLNNDVMEVTLKYLSLKDIFPNLKIINEKGELSNYKFPLPDEKRNEVYKKYVKSVIVALLFDIFENVKKNINQIIIKIDNKYILKYDKSDFGFKNTPKYVYENFNDIVKFEKILDDNLS